ncbi:MAG: PorV/PorQ family protein [Chitinophagales bacterium]|nr:PorV/PorQ family protein [Chitinophagales bacterium]
MKMRWLLLLCLYAGMVQAQLLPSYGDSRTATTGWQFLKVVPDARSAGMGEAFLAVADDMGSVYWNAAGLSKLDTSRWHTMLAHTAYPASINQYYGALAWRLNSNTLFAGSLQYFDAGSMPVTTEFQPAGNGMTFRPVNMALGASWSQVLTDAFSFGVTLKYVREDIADVHNQNMLFDLGFRYDIGIARTRFAVALTNFGFNTTPDGSIPVLSITDTTVIVQAEDVGVPTIFRLGFAWDALASETHQLTAAAQLNHPTDNNETYSIGLEYGWKKLLFVRSGYQFATDLAAWPSFGFGVRVPRYFGTVQLDYGFQYMNRLGTVNRIGLQLSL